MEVTTEKYIRKPLYVDAVRVKADNFDEMVIWCDGEVQTEEVQGTGTIKKFIKVRVHNPKNPRQTKAFIGDWILYTERGYKVYTNKAFRAAFDQVAAVAEQATAEEIREKLPHAQDRRRKPLEPVIDETIANQRIPKFYIDPATGGLVETPPDADMKPLSFSELMTIIRNELVGSGELGEPEPASEEEPSLYKTLSEEVKPQVGETISTSDTPLPPIQEVRPGDDLGDTPQGERIEVVEATSQAIADTVNEQQPVELDEEDATHKIEQAGQPEAVGAPDPVEEFEETPVPESEPVSEQAPEDAAAGKQVLSQKEQRDLGPDKVRELLSTGDVILAQDLATENV